MYMDYAVTFLNLDINKVGVDCFASKNEAEAVKDFKDCYRHGNYKVLSVVETGREIWNFLRRREGVVMFPKWVNEFGTILLQAFMITGAGWLVVFAWQDIGGVENIKRILFRKWDMHDL